MPLDRRLILQNAFHILNESGLEGLTLRRLAARLGVQAPALYWHFKNKQELLDHMATQVFREAIEDSPRVDDNAPWQTWAREYCQGLRRTLLRYREGAKMFSGTYLTDASLYAKMDANLQRMANAGFTPRQSIVALSTLYCFVVGFVIEEQAALLAPGQRNPQYNLAERQARIDKEVHPLAYAAGEVFFTGNDARFVESVNLILAGIAAPVPPA